MSQNREACAVVGVDVAAGRPGHFGLSAALAGGAAALVAAALQHLPRRGRAAHPQGVRGGHRRRLRLRQGRHRGRPSSSAWPSRSPPATSPTPTRTPSPSSSWWRCCWCGRRASSAGGSGSDACAACAGRSAAPSSWRSRGSSPRLAPGQQRYVLHVLVFTALYGGARAELRPGRRPRRQPLAGAPGLLRRRRLHRGPARHRGGLAVRWPPCAAGIALAAAGRRSPSACPSSACPSTPSRWAPSASRS